MNNPYYAPMPMGYHTAHSFAPPQPAPPPPGHQPLQSTDVHLEIRQEPKEALVTMEGKEKARKPVDPPPIVQLKVAAQADPNQHFLQSPYLFMTCSLCSAKDNTPIKAADGKPALSGSLVSSLHRLKDTDNHDGGFFVFGDVSVKVHGLHKLKFSLFDLHKDTMQVHFLAEIDSESFRVVQQKDFRGLDESTYLSRAFSDQGVRLRLRKEPRAFGNGGQKRNYNSYNNMPAGENMRQSQERAFDFGDDASSPTGAKRHRYNSEFNGTPQQHHTYAAGTSLHQPVRTPESMSSSFPSSASYNVSAGPFPPTFDFKPQMSTPNPYDSTPTTTSGTHSQMYGQIPGNYGYTSRSLFDTPHQPHGLGGYHSSGMQPGIRDDQEAAANSLQSLSVQPHSENMSGQSAHITENEFSGYAGAAVANSNFDPTLTGIARPKGRYEERVENHLQQIKSTKEEDGSAQQYQNAPYFSDSHLQVQPQHQNTES